MTSPQLAMLLWSEASVTHFFATSCGKHTMQKQSALVTMNAACIVDVVQLASCCICRNTLVLHLRLCCHVIPTAYRSSHTYCLRCLKSHQDMHKIL